MLKSDLEMLQLIEAECVTLVAQGASVNSCFNRDIYREWIGKIIDEDKGDIFKKILELGYDPVLHFYKILWSKPNCGRAFINRNPKNLDTFIAHINLSNPDHAWAVRELNLKLPADLPQNSPGRIAYRN